MFSKIFRLVATLALVSVLSACGQPNVSPKPIPGPSRSANQNLNAPSNIKNVAYKIEVVAENLYVPWSIVFTSPERMLFTERNGRLRIIQDGKLKNEPLHTFPEVSTTSEEGLMGLAIDPHYTENKFIYLSLAYKNQGSMQVKILRFQDSGTSLSEEKILLDHIPAAQYHAGCRLQFGPDQKLYITTGDATNKKLPQDLHSLGGKILRINNDGTIPNDNPFPDSPVYTFGHRNSQGLAWHPVTGQLWATEHGPTGFDGPPGGDEINLIEKGKNYGWPLVSHEKNQEGLAAPELLFTPAIAPSGAMFYSGATFPQWQNNFLFGSLKGEGIYRMVLSESDPTNIETHDKLDGIQVGRIREIMQGPDGYIYFSTSNRDGRGKLRTNDDKIYRIVPAEAA